VKLTATALRRPVAVTVLTLAVFVTGLFSLTRLAVDYLPEITYPMIKIHIWWRGATPDEIETNIAEPVERVLATVDDLDYLESSIIEGMYTLLVNFSYGVDVDVAYQDVMAAMGRVARNLPPDIDPPVIFKADPSQLPVMELTIASDSRDLVWLREWADNWLSERLVTVEGSAGVEVVGGLEREIRVHLDPQRLLAYGLSPADVSRAIFDNNREMFAGRVTVESREIIARTMGEFESLEEIENVVVALAAGGRLVYVKDLASVEDSHQEMRVNTRFDGQPCVKLNVLKQASANTVAVAEGIRARLEELRRDIPEDIQFGVVENQGEWVMGAVRSVEGSALLAAILVVLVVYLFLGRWRQVLVMIAALPVTVLANFFLMKTAGFSLNVFSLGGLVVALGVILDNSIVVMENITRLKEEGADDYAHRGSDEVAPAIVAATLTFLALFLPFLFIPGLSALLFKELVLVVAGIVVVSLLVALTLTPALTGRLLAGERGGGATGPARVFDTVLRRVLGHYRSALEPSLGRPWAAVGVAAFLFILGLALSRSVGSEFLPQVDDGRVMVKVIMPTGTAVGETDRILAEIERVVEGESEIQSLFTMAGGRVWGLATYEIANEGEVDIQLVPKSRRRVSTQEFIARIRPRVAQVSVPGARISVMQMKVKGIRQIGTQQVEVKVKGEEIPVIFEYAQSLAEEMGSAPGLTNANLSMDMTKPEYRIHVDRTRASALGIPVGAVASTLRGLVTGTVATQYREGTEYYDIRVMVPETALASRQDLESLVVEHRPGGAIYLRDVAEVRRAVGPVEIIREDQAKQVVVRADALGASVGEAAAVAERVAAGLKRPAGVWFEMGGQAQMMREDRRAMGLVLGFAALFAYVVLAVKFESFGLPLLIMLNVPFALFGAFLALFLVGTPVGSTVLVGLVVMMGGITSQGVVLVELAEQLRRSGERAVAAMARAAPIRLRPILMTQLTTVLGLMPLALNLGEGADMLQPMAIAVIGGLLWSLPLTLFFLPSAYTLLNRRRERSVEAGRRPHPTSRFQPSEPGKVRTQ
jgi:hydrophobic/amphiphilic exporter-1 (mainly G- bacteria), HAE1 family